MLHRTREQVRVISPLSSQIQIFYRPLFEPEQWHFLASLGIGHRFSVQFSNRNRHPPPQAEPISGQGEGQVQVLQAASLEQDIEPQVDRSLA